MARFTPQGECCCDKTIQPWLVQVGSTPSPGLGDAVGQRLGLASARKSIQEGHEPVQQKMEHIMKADQQVPMGFVVWETQQANKTR